MPQALAQLFELNFFYKLIKSEKVIGEISHEFKALPDDKSSVDFKFSTETNWLVELTSIRTNRNIKKERYWEEGDTFGFTLGNEELAKEVKRTQSILINKLHSEDKTRNIKFPLPQKNYFHALAIDMEGFNMNTHCDKHDCMSICGAYEIKNPNGLLYFNGSPIKGIFEENHPEPMSKAIRERIHFIIFFNCQNRFGESRIEFIANPHLFPTLEDARDAFKLFPFNTP
jgi:hypothetical protein